MRQEEKVAFAEAFADQYEHHEIDFIKFIDDKLGIPKKSYEQSWSHIKKELNSLLKFSNFYIFFLNNLDYLDEKAKICIQEINMKY